MSDRAMYRVLITVFVVLIITAMVYLVTEYISQPRQQEIEVNTKPIDIENDSQDMQNKENESNETKQVMVKYIDTYEECNHEYIYTEQHMVKNKKDLKDKVLNIYKEYYLLSEQEEMLVFERKYDFKCKEHYKVIVEDEHLVVYRINDEGEYAFYQSLQAEVGYIREDLLVKLKEGIYVSGIDELYILIEDIEG